MDTQEKILSLYDPGLVETLFSMKPPDALSDGTDPPELPQEVIDDNLVMYPTSEEEFELMVKQFEEDGLDMSGVLNE